MICAPHRLPAVAKVGGPGGSYRCREALTSAKILFTNRSQSPGSLRRKNTLSFPRDSVIACRYG